MSSWFEPRGQALLNAVRWLSDQHRHDWRAIEEAALRYDLSPADEAFLLQHCREEEPERLPPQ